LIHQQYINAIAYNNNMKVQVNKPTVKRQIRGVKFVRNGRGFSKSELKEAGIIDISMAKNNGIPIDILKKTKAENIEQQGLLQNIC
jgi:ribosomal protein L13E